MSSWDILKISIAIVTLAALWLCEGIVPMFCGRRNRAAHDARNISLGVCNAILVALLLSGALAGAAVWAADSRFGLLHQISLPTWAHWVLALILFDLWMYGWHVTNHRVPLLWRFHQVHHADADLDASSALRFHTVEILLSASARLGVIPLLGMTFDQLLVYEMILQPVILFHHSNVRLPHRVDRWLRCLIVTPRIHWVHHSKLRSEHDGNYASVLSVWDRLFRTLRWKNPHDIEMGLPTTGDAETHQLKSMWMLPFRPRR